MNYYSLGKLIKIFSPQYNILPLVIFFFISFPLAEIIDRLFHSLPTRIVYYIASAMMGFIFILFCSLLILEIVNFVHPIFNYKITGWILFIGVLSISGFAIINALTIHIKKINIDNFGKEIKIVHLTDIHVGTIWNSRTLKKIIDKTNAQNPDLVLITGDLVDGSGKLTPDTFQPLEQLQAPAYFIMGNHEMYAGPQKIKDLLKNTNIKILENTVEVFNDINIIGVNYSEKTKFFQDIFKKLEYDKSLPTIFLNHAPVGYEEAKNNGVNLQLSGHTHNGQIFPFSLLVKMRFKKKIGIHPSDNFTLYISPGTGTWGPPMRLGSRNEITTFNLK